MNKIVATISKIENIENLNIVEFDFSGLTLKMMSLDLGDMIIKGKKVVLSTKPTHVSIGKNISGVLSYSNQLSSSIVDIERGELLSVVTLSVNGINLQSMITTKSANRMELQVDDEVTILIKASDLSISEVLDV